MEPPACTRVPLHRLSPLGPAQLCSTRHEWVCGIWSRCTSPIKGKVDRCAHLLLKGQYIEVHISLFNVHWSRFSSPVKRTDDRGVHLLLVEQLNRWTLINTLLHSWWRCTSTSHGEGRVSGDVDPFFHFFGVTDWKTGRDVVVYQPSSEWPRMKRTCFQKLNALKCLKCQNI